MDSVKKGTIPIAITNSTDAIDKPTSIFGNAEAAYGLLVYNSNSSIPGIINGISLVFGYTYVNDTYGAQLRIDYTGGCAIRSKANGIWSFWESLK